MDDATRHQTREFTALARYLHLCRRNLREADAAGQKLWGAYWQQRLLDAYDQLEHLGAWDAMELYSPIEKNH